MPIVGAVASDGATLVELALPLISFAVVDCDFSSTDTKFGVTLGDSVVTIGVAVVIWACSIAFFDSSIAGAIAESGVDELIGARVLLVSVVIGDKVLMVGCKVCNSIGSSTLLVDDGCVGRVGVVVSWLACVCVSVCCDVLELAGLMVVVAIGSDIELIVEDDAIGSLESGIDVDVDVGCSSQMYLGQQSLTP